MIEAIARLRRTADECGRRARMTKGDGTVAQPELMEVSVKLHWLAREAAQLCNKIKGLEGRDRECPPCCEKCPG